MRIRIRSFDKPAKGPSLALAQGCNFTYAKNVMLVIVLMSVKSDNVVWPDFSLSNRIFE
jgi:hypothetical protein